jgi:hypothetical protein
MCLDDYTFKHSNVETMFQNIEMSSFCFDKGFEIFDMIQGFYCIIYNFMWFVVGTQFA